MTETQIKFIIGAVAAAATAVATYAFTQGIITDQVVIAVNALIAFVAGVLTPKSVTRA